MHLYTIADPWVYKFKGAQKNWMQFQPKLLASGVPTSWCPSVTGSRCLGVSVFRVVSRCTVSRVFYNLFSNCFLDACIQAIMGQSCSCTVCKNTVLLLVPQKNWLAVKTASRYCLMFLICSVLIQFMLSTATLNGYSWYWTREQQHKVYPDLA